MKYVEKATSQNWLISTDKGTVAS